MSDAAFLREAQGWRDYLVKEEARGPGDIDNAMIRIEQKFGIPYSVLWALKYRPPKELQKWMEICVRLHGAFEAVKDAQRRKLRDEINTAPKAGAAAYLVRAATRLAGEEDGA